MDMRLPGSGSLFESFLDGLGRSANDSTGGSTVTSVTPVELDQALEALQQGHIEYVILQHGEAFLQAAGEGVGPYQVEFRSGSDRPMQEIRGGVDVDRLGSIMRAYIEGGDLWRPGPEWSAMP